MGVPEQVDVNWRAIGGETVAGESDGGGPGGVGRQAGGVEATERRGFLAREERERGNTRRGREEVAWEIDAVEESEEPLDIFDDPAGPSEVPLVCGRVEGRESMSPEKAVVRIVKFQFHLLGIVVVRSRNWRCVESERESRGRDMVAE